MCDQINFQTKVPFLFAHTCETFVHLQLFKCVLHVFVCYVFDLI